MAPGTVAEAWVTWTVTEGSEARTLTGGCHLVGANSGMFPEEEASGVFAAFAASPRLHLPVSGSQNAGEVQVLES